MMECFVHEISGHLSRPTHIGLQYVCLPQTYEHISCIVGNVLKKKRDESNVCFDTVVCFDTLVKTGMFRRDLRESASSL